MLIKFKKIETKDNKFVFVTLSKIKSTNETVNAKLSLERKKDGYVIILSEAVR